MMRDGPLESPLSSTPTGGRTYGIPSRPDGTPKVVQKLAKKERLEKERQVMRELVDSKRSGESENERYKKFLDGEDRKLGHLPANETKSEREKRVMQVPTLQKKFRVDLFYLKGLYDKQTYYLLYSFIYFISTLWSLYTEFITLF